MEGIATSAVDFPTWFSGGCYSGLVCCIMTSVLNALFTTQYKRGTTRQLASAIVICAVCALLMFPAIVWYDMRFSIEQASLSIAEVETMLVYVVLFGWVIPVSTTCSYLLFTLPRTSTNSVRIASQKRSTRLNKARTIPQPPRHKPGVKEPFVYGEDRPWGWLEYRTGSFQGQRLELKRRVVTIGRDENNDREENEENNDIALVDDKTSRHHAELAWDKGLTYITDCDSTNGVWINGRCIRGSVQIEANELLEIGSVRFIFIRAEEKSETYQTDPLLKRASRKSLPAGSDFLTVDIEKTHSDANGQALPGSFEGQWQETAQISAMSPPSRPTELSGVITIQNGAMAGQCFLMDRPVITVGRSIECDIVIDDVSISRQHAQFLRQVNGNYVQDLSSRNGTWVNNEPLPGPHLLATEDDIRMGNICMKYASVQTARTAPLSLIIKPQRSMSGPMSLRLPSKRKV